MRRYTWLDVWQAWWPFIVFLVAIAVILITVNWAIDQDLQNAQTHCANQAGLMGYPHKFVQYDRRTHFCYVEVAEGHWYPIEQVRWEGEER